MATNAQATSSQSSSNAVTTPEFILDYKEWTIKRYSACKADIEKEGYGVISYAWGKWHNKAKCAKVGTAGYPKFDIGNDSSTPPEPLSWIFPIVNQKDSTGAFTNAEQFTIADIKNALGSLGTRYIWWDWACIPQGWDFDRVTNKDPGPEFHVHKDLEAVKGPAMNNMRYFYPASKRGCLWWHQTTWSPGTGNAMPIEDLLNCLQDIVLAGYKSLTNVKVQEYVDKLEKAKEWEMSLQSLWSFQEGVLFADSARPKETIQLKADDPLLAPGVILDRLGRPLKPKNASSGQIHTFQFGQADLVDIYATTTIIASQIAGALIGNASGSSPFQSWLTDTNNNAQARGLLSKLIASGMVGYTYNSPLPLLEARFGRNFGRSSDADITVNCLVGALSIDIGDFQEAAKKIKKDTADSQKAANADKATIRQKSEEAELGKLVDGFLPGLFNAYQWRMLLLARDKPVGKAVDEGFWKSLIGKARPKFAALEGYIGEVALSQTYGPSVPTAVKPKEIPKEIVPNLPTISMPNVSLGALVVHGSASQPYSGYNFTAKSAASTGWKSCTFYAYVAPSVLAPAGAAAGGAAATSTSLGGTVAALPISFATRDSTFGQDILLLPIETVTDQKLPPPVTFVDKLFALVSRAPPTIDPKVPIIRCAIVTNFDSVGSKGNFFGIGDFTGLGAGTFPVQKDISLY